MDNASGDISTVAWSPNGRVFAAGAVAVTDEQSQQYNKPKNLIVGDASQGNIKVLPQHQVPRPIVRSGENSKDSMRRSQDAVVYPTVQMVAFAPDGENMYSVSFDNRLNLYSIRDDILDTEYLGSINHKGPVDLLSVRNSIQERWLVATACRYPGPESIRVIDNDCASTSLSATNLTTLNKYPSALKWGIAHQHSRFLLAGFSCEVERVYEEDNQREKDGETCLWDMNTCQPVDVQAANRNVFDLAWNPNPSSASTLFAVACGSAGKSINPGIHSVVRLYAPHQGGRGASRVAELDCSAWDINDVVYSPHDDHIIAVGDTEGKVHIWDLRHIKKEQEPLRTLVHAGEAKSTLPHGRNRWEVDTGVRFLSWGAERNRVYTGSSDGVVKCWDPYRSDDDKYVRDVATFQSAVMSGAFSPDNCSLLIGEEKCQLNLLTIGNEWRSNADMEVFRVHEAPEKQAPCDSFAQELIQSGQIETRPVGALPVRQAVQGPRYSDSGMYRTDLKATSLRDAAADFQEKLYRMQVRNNKFVHSLGHTPSPCTLDCVHFATNLDEYGDLLETGRSRDRIPGNLRHPGLLSRLEAQRQGLVAKCSSCAKPARPVDADDDRVDDAGTAKALCEDCNFSCFRCSQPARVSGLGLVIECLSCEIAWQADVLGYTIVRNSKKRESNAAATSRMTTDDVAIEELREEDSDELEIAGPEMSHYFDQGR
ncbi:hypothetical protein MBLNU459_g3528t1 [Dothideomycetes sp. NU459]